MGLLLENGTRVKEAIKSVTKPPCQISSGT